MITEKTKHKLMMLSILALYLLAAYIEQNL